MKSTRTRKNELLKVATDDFLRKQAKEALVKRNFKKYLSR